jgi:hypothetical protein
MGHQTAAPLASAYAASTNNQCQQAWRIWQQRLGTAHCCAGRGAGPSTGGAADSSAGTSGAGTAHGGAGRGAGLSTGGAADSGAGISANGAAGAGGQVIS